MEYIFKIQDKYWERILDTSCRLLNARKLFFLGRTFVVLSNLIFLSFKVVSSSEPIWVNLIIFIINLSIWGIYFVLENQSIASSQIIVETPNISHFEKEQKQIDIFIAITLLLDFCLLYYFWTMTQSRFITIQIIIALVGFHSFYFPSYIFKQNNSTTNKKSWEANLRLIHFFTGGMIVAVLLGTWLIFYPSGLYPKNTNNGYYCIFGFFVVGGLSTFFRKESYKRYVQIDQYLTEIDKEKQQNNQKLEENNVLNKELIYANSQLELTNSNLVSLQNNIIEIAQVLKSTSSVEELQRFNHLPNLQSLVKKIGLFLNVDYCGVGFTEGEKILINANVWIKSASDIQKNYQLTLDDSFIGYLIKQNDNEQIYTGRYEDLSPDIPIKYKLELSKELSSRKLHNYIVFFLKNKEQKIIGYIHLINKLQKEELLDVLDENGFTDFEKNAIKMIATQIELTFQNYIQEKSLVSTKYDEELINELMEETSPEKIYSSILEHFTENMGVSVASFWFPFWNGYEITEFSEGELPGGKDLNCFKILLRDVRVSRTINNYSTIEDQMQKFKSTKLETNSFLGNIIKENYISSSGVNDKKTIKDFNQIIFHKITKNECIWPTLFNSLEVDTGIIIPILKSDSKYMNDDARAKAEHITGVLYLKIKSEDLNSSFLQERMVVFAQNISLLFEKLIYKRRYEQIEKLKNDLFSLGVYRKREFYNKVVEIVNNSMHTEACSLFLVENKDSKHFLSFQASTAEYIRVEQENLNKKNVGNNYFSIKNTESLYDSHPYDLHDSSEKSLTAPIFGGFTCINYFEHTQSEVPFFSKHKFLEETPRQRHDSYIAVPIIKFDTREIIGVIRCINKSTSNVLYPTFTQSDKNYLMLVAGILSKFFEVNLITNNKIQNINVLIHEFGHPLTSIKANILRAVDKVKVIDKSTNTDNLIDILNRQKNQVERLDYFINIFAESIQDFDTIPTYLPLLRKIWIQPLIEDLIKIHRPEASVKSINIVTNFENLPRRLFTDSEFFIRVFTNVLKNAIKYTNTNIHLPTTITISYERTHKKFDDISNAFWDTFTISNDGIGIDKLETEKIFEERFRSSKAEQKNIKGSGLGLYHSKKLMDSLKGKIILEQNEKPTIFRIYFPAIP